MPRSLRVRHDYIEKVRVAVARNGYPNQKALAHDTGLSRSTVSKFMTGNPVDYATFEELCRRLNLDWQEITTSAEVIFTPPAYAQIRKKKTKFKSIPRLGNCN
jgi:transcriptional regulator with XRE-family HTH domain